MNVIQAMNSHLDRLRPIAIAVGALATLACIGGVVVDPAQFFRSYLFAFLFWLGIALGSLGIEMIHHLTGGVWGFVIRRVLEAASMTLPLLGLLFIPIFFGMHALFIWTHPSAIAPISELRHKTPFLNVPWFIVRAVLYFIIWSVMAWLLRRWSLQQDRTGDPAITQRFQHACGPGLILYFLTMSIAAIDWIMSLEPRWYSTTFGLVVISGQGLAALAFATLSAISLTDHKALADLVKPKAFHDLGNLLLAFMLMWAYLAFTQYLIIWSGNLSDESTWYIHRGHGGWQTIGLALIVFHFLLPFVALLFGTLKKNYRTLAVLALYILAAHILDVFYLVLPTFYTHSFHVHWLDVSCFLAIGGWWLTCFSWTMWGKSPVPLHDPRLEGVFNAEEAIQRG